MSSEAGQQTVSRRAGMVRMLSLDIVGPLVAYQLLRSAGLAEVWSLVLAGTLPGFGVLIDYLRWRTIDVVGVVVLGGIGLSIVLALLTNDPKIVLLESAALTGAFGLGCLLSLATRRPLIFYFGQAFYGGRHSVPGAEMETEYDQYPEARSFWCTVTVVWGLTHIVLAAVLTAIVQTASTGTALTFNRTVPWVLTAALIGWAVWWGERLRAEQPTDEQHASD